MLELNELDDFTESESPSNFNSIEIPRARREPCCCCSSGEKEVKKRDLCCCLRHSREEGSYIRGRSPTIEFEGRLNLFGWLENKNIRRYTEVLVENNRCCQCCKRNGDSTFTNPGENEDLNKRMTVQVPVDEEKDLKEEGKRVIFVRLWLFYATEGFTFAFMSIVANDPYAQIWVSILYLALIVIFIVVISYLMCKFLRNSDNSFLKKYLGFLSVEVVGLLIWNAIQICITKF